MKDLFINQIDKIDTAYIQLVKEVGTVFNDPVWLGLFGDRLQLFGIFNNRQTLVGAFTLWNTRKFGFRYLKSPLTAPHNALIYRNTKESTFKQNSFEKDLHATIADFLKSQRASIIQFGLGPEVKDVQPYLWKGFKVSPTYTYRINLEQEIIGILDGFDPKLKSDIAKAKRDGVMVGKTDDMEEVRLLVRKTGNRRRETGDRMIDKILTEFSGEGRSFAFVARKDGKVVATVYCVHDIHTAYYILGGYDNDVRQRGAAGFALQEAILYAKEIGLVTFDFEGSMIPSIELFFRGFGGELTPEFTVHRACLPLEMVLKLAKRSVY